jgi:Tfp pilus assembly protein PilX
VVLGTSIVLLMVITLIALFMGQTLSTEAKIQGNSFRDQQAFSAAQGGLEYAINYAQTNRATITDGQTLTGTQADNSTYSTVLNFVGGNSKINVVSTGRSADGTATRIVKQVIIVTGGSGIIPPGPIASRGNVSLANNVAVTNLYGATTIVTGGAVSMKNNSQTVLASGVSSTPGNIQSDITQNNTGIGALSDSALQTTYVGMALSSFQSVATNSYSGTGTQDYSAQLSGQAGKVIYINQGSSGTVTMANNLTVGTSSSPTTIVIIGNATFNNGITLNGNIYVTGNITIGNNTTINGYVFAVGNITLSNNGIINGAAVAGGTTTAASNNAAINYNPTNLNNNNVVGGTNYGKVSGSWQDMNL